MCTGHAAGATRTARAAEHSSSMMSMTKITKRSFFTDPSSFAFV